MVAPNPVIGALIGRNQVINVHRRWLPLQTGRGHPQARERLEIDLSL